MALAILRCSMVRVLWSFAAIQALLHSRFAETEEAHYQMTPKVAALFVAKNGCYFGLPDVDPWDEERDARLYRGSWPVVAHPPCQRWGRYWSGGPSAKDRLLKGDDRGCFAAALFAARSWGGVIEHPEASWAWEWFGLAKPPKKGQWLSADNFDGYTCCVEQGHYGHRARKATWLYVCKPVDLPNLIWGPCSGKDSLDESFRSNEERRVARASGVRPKKRLSAYENLATPPAFRDILLNLARSCNA